MAKVYLGVGHGGKDSGAVGNGFYEKNLNLTISLACRNELKRHGVDVKISRENDTDFKLENRITDCNAFKPDLALDIHNNAGGGDGVEVYYYHGGGTSKTLAENVLNAITEIGQNSRGIKTKLSSNGTDYFGFIRQTVAPAVIVECAFVDNANDIKIIDTEYEQKTMGIAIAKGVLKTLGIEYVEEYVEPSIFGYLDKFETDGTYGGWAKWSNGVVAKVSIHAKNVNNGNNYLIAETNADDIRSDVGQCAFNGFADISKLESGDYIISATVENLPLNNQFNFRVEKKEEVFTDFENQTQSNKENTENEVASNEKTETVKDNAETENTTQTSILEVLRLLLRLILNWVKGK